MYCDDFNMQSIILTHFSKPSLSETCFKRALMKILKFKNAEMYQIVSMQIQVFKVVYFYEINTHRIFLKGI